MALGYVRPSESIRKHVETEDTLFQRTLTNGGEQEVLTINESGLYALLMSSKLPTAKQFKRWVTSDVLPSIRKHGAYMTPDTLENVLLNPDTLIRLAMNLKGNL